MIIEPALPSDTPYVMDSWLKGWRANARGIPTSAFYPWARAQATAALAAPGCTVLTLRDDPYSDWLCSYIVADISDRITIHWAATKMPYRRKGYAHALLREVLAKASTDQLHYSILTPGTKYLESLGFTHRKLHK